MSKSIEIVPKPSMYVNAPPHMLFDVALGTPIWIPGLWNMFAQAIANQAGVAGRVFITPVWLSQKAVITHLAMRLGVLGGAGTNIRLGLYKDNSGTPQGGQLLVGSGNIAADGTNVRGLALTNPLTVEKGLVWFALETEDTEMNFVRNSNVDFFSDIGSEMVRACHYDRSGGYGALTDPCPAITANTSARLMCFMRITSFKG